MRRLFATRLPARAELERRTRLITCLSEADWNIHTTRLLVNRRTEHVQSLEMINTLADAGATEVDLSVCLSNLWLSSFKQGCQTSPEWEVKPTQTDPHPELFLMSSRKTSDCKEVQKETSFFSLLIVYLLCSLFIIFPFQHRLMFIHQIWFI